MSQIKASDTKPSTDVVLTPFVQELLSFCSTRPENQWKRATGKTLKQLTGDATNVYVMPRYHNLLIIDRSTLDKMCHFLQILLQQVDLLLLRTRSL